MKNAITAPDFGSIEIDIDGLTRIQVCQGIDYEDTLEPEAVFGNSAQAQMWTRGQYKATGTIKLIAREHQNLVKIMGEGFLEKEFNIRVKTLDTDNKGLIVDTLVGVRLTGNKSSNSPGAAPKTIEVPLIVRYVKWNGVNPLFNMLE